MHKSNQNKTNDQRQTEIFFFHLVPHRVFFLFGFFFRKSLKHYSGSNEERCCEMPRFVIDGQHRSD